MKWSVITVTYQNLNGLRDTFHSVAEQESTDFEWIVIDGGSRDGTAEFLKSLEMPNLHWVSEKDKGIFDAMNKGIERAQGEYCIFMNAGDRFNGSAVLTDIEGRVGEEKPDVIYGDAIESGEGRQFYKKARDPKWNFYVMFTHHQSIFYKTEIIKGGYDLFYKFSGDWALTTNILKKPGVSLKYCQQAVCVFERGGISQRSDQRARINFEHWNIYRKESKLNLPLAAILWFAKTKTNAIRNLIPGFYDFVRYR